MKKEWNKTIDELMVEHQVTDRGLSLEQVESIRAEKGENALLEGKRKSVMQVFFSQFADLLVIILIIAASISFVSGNTESTLVILLVLLMNAVLGTVQHVKAQKSLDSLKQLSSPSAKVIREGKKIEIPSREVVPGDIVILEAGDMIVADGRILNNYSLQVNESSLTGESTNVEKTEAEIQGDVALADRTNMVYSGSLVTYGRAKVLITATGMHTELGKIAGLMNAAKERKTPLQESLDAFSGKLAMLIMIICGLVFVLCLYRDMEVLDSMMFAVALAVAAIPEALSSIVTIVQAFGTQKMAKENAIIKDLKAVESLGCVSVICSDKTGTLTQNKMTVQKVYVDGQEINPKGMNLSDETQRYLLYDAVLTNDSSIVAGKGIGDPTEYALIEMFRNLEHFQKAKNEEAGVLKAACVSEEDDFENILRGNMPRLEELPFDSDRKLMTTVNKNNGKYIVYTKGGIDELLRRCKAYEINNEVHNDLDNYINTIREKNEEMAREALRVLGCAYKEIEHIPSKEEMETIENDLIFIGMVGMIDPPREEAKEAVEKCKTAGIKVVMITGDHKITATAIARKLGILENDDEAITGAELEQMSDEDLEKNVRKYSVYARVSPEHKVRIVTAWQKNGEVVAMTGDGVNDSPALKKSDIGCAMGIVGTDVAKEAADVILTDDNFATVVSAVEEGRRIYDNILKAIQFLLSSNIGEIVVLFIAILITPWLSSYFGIDVNEKVGKMLCAGCNSTSNQLPIIAICDTFGRVVYFSQGYNTSIGEQLKYVIHKL